MAFVKICGITNLEDALLSVAAGADALGFNFYRPSPRYIEPLAAREIMDRLPGNVLTVGVFVNEATPETVERISSDAGVAAVQLHGDESPEYCRALRGRYVIKVLTAGNDFEPQRALDYEVQAIMLDTFDPQMRGGTGRVMDWSVARRTRALVPKFFLAGGLAPENVQEAITAVNPYGVDACSALEISPGKKLPDRVAAFVKAARASQLPLNVDDHH
ncbi:MAG: phosphoribosylanthranilate isomerase [Pyrinomonadaceae bacterium]|nr:phosphoribosylanthranilate isomerase [Pyrinomonadaceae bacterium]